MSRERLGNRRRCETIEFCHAGHAFTLSTGRFRDGRLAEALLIRRSISARPWNPSREIALFWQASRSKLESMSKPSGMRSPATMTAALQQPSGPHSICFAGNKNEYSHRRIFRDYIRARNALGYPIMRWRRIMRRLRRSLRRLLQ